MRNGAQLGLQTEGDDGSSKQGSESVRKEKAEEKMSKARAPVGIAQTHHPPARPPICLRQSVEPTLKTPYLTAECGMMKHTSTKGLWSFMERPGEEEWLFLISG
jgi:hypothetical protein